MCRIYKGNGIFHCYSIQHKAILHGIEIKYALSRMKMPNIEESAIARVLVWWHLQVGVRLLIIMCVCVEVCLFIGLLCLCVGLYLDASYV